MEVKTCVVCGTKYNLGEGFGHYCSTGCYRNTTSKKPPPVSPDDHDSWPDSVGYGGIPICDLPAGVYEAAESNADDWRVVEDITKIFAVLKEAAKTYQKEYNQRKQRKFLQNLKAVGIEDINEYNKRRLKIHEHLGIKPNKRVGNRGGSWSLWNGSGSVAGPGDYWSPRSRIQNKRKQERYLVKNNKIVPIDKKRGPLK